jgi:hypothetical protein
MIRTRSKDRARIAIRAKVGMISEISSEKVSSY